MEAKVVLVTGIGGNVGQGILRNIKKTNYPIKLIGCNTISFSAGNYLCDITYDVPLAAMEAEYIQKINYIIAAEQVDLIIPSTDSEVYILSKYRNQLNTEIACSGSDTAQMYLDKYQTFIQHNKYNIPFANSILPSQYKNDFKNVIAKPREGRGSRGIVLNPTNCNDFDDTYMIQELHKGTELTCAFYITKQNKLHGLITMARSLSNGTTIDCRIEKKYDLVLEKIILKMIQFFDIKGAANIQFIATENGEIIPFEVNCRISGTNSIRSNFGFEDVKYTLQEYLYHEIPDTPNVLQKGFATRVLLDVIYPNANSSDECINSNLTPYIF